MKEFHDQPPRVRPYSRAAQRTEVMAAPRDEQQWVADSPAEGERGLGPAVLFATEPAEWTRSRERRS